MSHCVKGNQLTGEVLDFSSIWQRSEKDQPTIFSGTVLVLNWLQSGPAKFQTTTLKTSASLPVSLVWFCFLLILRKINFWYIAPAPGSWQPVKCSSYLNSTVTSADTWFCYSGVTLVLADYNTWTTRCAGHWLYAPYCFVKFTLLK